MRYIKHQLILFALFSLYIIIRLIGISDIDFTFWQSIWVFAVKDSLLLLIMIFFTYFILDSIRHRPRIGPRIISGKTLKKILYPALTLSWLAVVIHTFFEAVKILLPFKLLPLYQFADFMDETISHVFMFLPVIIMLFIATFLEIERPLPEVLAKKETIFLSLLSFLSGIIWGLNLTEGRLAFATSLPVMLIYLFSTLYFFKKYNLKLLSRPWNLTVLIVFASGSISLIAWNLIFQSTPELFTILQ